MTRKHTRRRVIVPLPPRGLRPKLDAHQVNDLTLAHVANLDIVARGQATEEVLWQWIGGVLTWSRVATLLQVGEPEMAQQLELTHSLVERYGRTGRGGFSGTEYQLAKDGLQVMDQLAEMVDRATAIAAAAWSENKVDQLVAECARREGTVAC